MTTHQLAGKVAGFYKDFFKCREFAGPVTAERVTAGFIVLRRCLSDLEPREKIKAPPSTEHDRFPLARPLSWPLLEVL